jgi:hypothetical protein
MYDASDAVWEIVGKRSMSVWVIEIDTLSSLGLLLVKIDAEDRGNCDVQNDN